MLDTSYTTIWKDLDFFLVLTLKKKKKAKTTTELEDPQQSEHQLRTPRSRILRLSTSAICDSSTKANTEIRTSEQNQPSHSGLVQVRRFLLFVQGSFSFVFFERPG